jgi:hypothetical protein
MVYILSAILTGGVLTAICWPLFANDDSVESVILEETEWDLLGRKKDVVLGNIQDLDFEYKCGKLSDSDYKRIRDEFSAEVAGVYAKIDQIESDQDLNALIRTEVASRMDKKPAEASKSLTCPECDHVNTMKNKFCSECGTKLL